MSQNSKSMNSFTERLQERKTKNELRNNDLSKYMKKKNLATRLENIKKAPSETE